MIVDFIISHAENRRTQGTDVLISEEGQIPQGRDRALEGTPENLRHQERRRLPWRTSRSDAWSQTLFLPQHLHEAWRQQQSQLQDLPQSLKGLQRYSCCGSSTCQKQYDFLYSRKFPENRQVRRRRDDFQNHKLLLHERRSSQRRAALQSQFQRSSHCAKRIRRQFPDQDDRSSPSGDVSPHQPLKDQSRKAQKSCLFRLQLKQKDDLLQTLQDHHSGRRHR